MKNPFKNTIVSETKTNREFSYSKDEVTLKFTLRIDIKHQLRDFKTLLEQALKDIDEELAKHN